SALRRALGERPGDNRFIVTVPGDGYLFVANVTQSSTLGVPATRFPTLIVTTPTSHEMALSRGFDSPPERLFEASQAARDAALRSGRNRDTAIALTQLAEV